MGKKCKYETVDAQEGKLKKDYATRKHYRSMKRLINKRKEEKKNKGLA